VLLSSMTITRTPVRFLESATLPSISLFGCVGGRSERRLDPDGNPGPLAVRIPLP
jgi:hypothetical protein